MERLTRSGSDGAVLDATGWEDYRLGMTRGVRQVLDEALKLSPEEQTQVLRELLMRFEGEADPDAEAAWADEIERRAHEARAGTPAAGDWETVCDEIEAELNGR
jgi:putative addiction module component (TIGR02574 family)